MNTEDRNNELYKRVADERNAKIHFANHLIDLVMAGKELNVPSNMSEEDKAKWDKFQAVLNNCPVTSAATFQSAFLGNQHE